MAMNRSLYPKNWEQIALAIKQEANWTCESCGRPCTRPGESASEFVQRISDEMPLWLSLDPKNHPRRFLLSVAHLDHQPQNCDRSNLKAWCCPCHCRYDLGQMPRKKLLKAERQGQLTLDDLSHSLFEQWSGDQLSILPNVSPYRIESLFCSGGSTPPEPNTPKASPSPEPPTRIPHRQHRTKGNASGWLEPRQGNQNRKNPTISYYYRWDSPAGRVNEYVRASRLPKVNRLIAENRPALEILEVVTQGKKLSGVSAKLLNQTTS